MRVGRLIGLALLLFLLPSLVLYSQTKARSRRAASPKWDRSEVKDVFFENIFDGKVLIGQRPANLGASSAGAVVSNTKPGASSTDAEAGTTASGWSALIASSTIEDEIKAAKSQIDQSVTTPTEFAGKGYKQARVTFTVLSMLFGVIGEYEGDVRWKKDAPSARDAFARAAANAKAGGNAQVFNEAKLRKQDLHDLIGGGGISNNANAELKANWPQLCDRSPLMIRLEAALETKLKPSTADAGDFKAEKDHLLHEAQMVGTIAEVLSKEGMPDADASEYKEFCARLKKAAQEVTDAIKLNSDEQARKAVGEINKTCVDCHGSYRA